ncbi:transketolase C-terminal domain-containing protein [Alphaproteobacteria bacterium]|nr:transketolase C-terminal domain-containing protein [Alphaproteobacteria bacterium]
MTSEYQRDVVIKTIYEHAKNNKDIYFLSADFGAPALDEFRDKLPNQFIHTGISEQNTIDLAAGLSLEGRIVFVYAMAPFITLRCLEQHKCATGMMNSKVCTLVAGIGLGYADAGPTHYATEDLSCLQALIKSEVITISDPNLAKEATKDIIQNPRYSFIRMDRHPTNDLSTFFNSYNYLDGFRFNGNDKKLCVISTGGIINNIINAQKILNANFTICDLFLNKPINKKFIDFINEYENILCVDEQSTGGLSHSILELLNENNIFKKLNIIKLPEKYIFENGGRDLLLDKYNLSPKKIASFIKNLL